MQLAPAGGTLAEIGRAGGWIFFSFLFFVFASPFPFLLSREKNKIAPDPNRAGGMTRTARLPHPPLNEHLRDNGHRGLVAPLL